MATNFFTPGSIFSHLGAVSATPAARATLTVSDVLATAGISPAVAAIIGAAIGPGGGAAAGGPAGGGAGTGTTGTAPPATAPSNLQALLALIPIAQAGHVIGPEYHNSLRDAVFALAGLLGAAPTAATFTLTFTPTFAPNDAGPGWRLLNGIAVRAEGQANANGLLPLQLPDGVRIQGMTVIGNRTGTMAGFQVRLVRQTIANSDAVDLVNLLLREASSPFTVSGSVQVQNVTETVQLEQYRLVDNTTYKYFVIGRIPDAAADAVAEVRAVQILFRP